MPTTRAVRGLLAYLSRWLGCLKYSLDYYVSANADYQSEFSSNIFLQRDVWNMMSTNEYWTNMGGSQQQIMITPMFSSLKQTPIPPPLQSLSIKTISFFIRTGTCFQLVCCSETEQKVHYDSKLLARIDTSAIWRCRGWTKVYNVHPSLQPLGARPITEL